MHMPPQNIKDTAEYFRKAFFTLPRKDEIIEAIGYPNQKGSQTTNNGCVMTLGRLHYGPGRYDYGRIVMPKSWFGNWFFFLWEFGHLMFVSERWIFMRFVKHVIFTGIFFFPLMMSSKWHKQEQDNQKEWRAIHGI